MAKSDTDALVDAAGVICRMAKTISARFSRRIPAATHVGTNNGMVAVITDGNVAPNAAPFEAGELHPLWAHVGSWRYEHWKWGKQPTRPYMIEAATAKIDEAAEAYAQSVYDYARRFGFK
jgi:hypothetical protein